MTYSLLIGDREIPWASISGLKAFRERILKPDLSALKELRNFVNRGMSKNTVKLLKDVKQLPADEALDALGAVLESSLVNPEEKPLATISSGVVETDDDTDEFFVRFNDDGTTTLVD